jgi:phage FluMu protein Com
MTTAHTALAEAPAVSRATDDDLELVCPRCGLNVRPPVPSLAIEHCPRCIALARVPVKLHAETRTPRGPGRRRFGA